MILSLYIRLYIKHHALSNVLHFLIFAWIYLHMHVWCRLENWRNYIQYVNGMGRLKWTAILLVARLQFVFYDESCCISFNRWCLSNWTAIFCVTVCWDLNSCFPVNRRGFDSRGLNTLFHIFKMHWNTLCSRFKLIMEYVKYTIKL